MKTIEWLEKTNLMNKNYLAQILGLITLLDEGEELKFGLIKVRKLDRTMSGYRFEVEIEDIELEELKKYYKVR